MHFQRFLGAGIALVCLTLIGCEDTAERGVNTQPKKLGAADVPPKVKPIPPDNMPPMIEAARLSFDPETRTLHLYPLAKVPDSTVQPEWLVYLPSTNQIMDVKGLTYTFAAGEDLEKAAVMAVHRPGPPSRLLISKVKKVVGAK